ncbi:hypothetical protein GGQ85_003648 [Nitrobacter vulgaris]|uniref:ATP-binding protein n=1 Tax=Nitrobacter vulgaris TaxID=29421 RepID=UPI0028626C4F|nr:DUF87 domain-containing protein [Nitrobacter vulgaris]MDR6305922.1 hypothetical protein [Nitrobacter vulgaris]
MATDTNIRLNDNTNIDLSKLIESRLLVQANSGGGKSWALRRLLEQTHGKVQQIVIDSEGEFSTLREKHDFILAGKGGDTPAEPRSAALLARKLLELKVSAIIDLYELHPQDRKRFVRLFLDALINAPKELWHPCIIVIDEAHTYAPEKGQSEAMDAVIGLAALGRKRGFCAVLATQRISKLNKDAAAECNNKLIGRATQDIDMKRAGDELGFASRDQMLSLRALRPGEFYAFGPAISDEVTRVTIGPVRTTHPKAGSRALTRTVPPTSAIKQVLGELADLPAEAEQEAKTVAELKQQVKSLTSQLRTPPVEKLPQEKTKIVEVPVLKDAQILRLERVFGGMVKESARHGGAMTLLWTTFDEIGKAMIAALDDIKRGPAPAKATRSAPTPSPTAEIPISAPPSEGLSAARQRVLDALAWLSAIGIERANKVQLAFLSDQSPRSSGYSNNLGALRSAGMIEYLAQSEVALTATGRSFANVPKAPATSEELQNRIQSKLPRAQWAILKVLIDQYPEELAKDDLAAASGQSPTSSGYSNNLGAMRSLGLLDYPSPGQVKAEPILFL